MSRGCRFDRIDADHLVCYEHGQVIEWPIERTYGAIARTILYALALFAVIGVLIRAVIGS